MRPVSAAFLPVTQSRVNTTWGRKFGRRAGPTRIPNWRSWALPVAHASHWELTGYLRRKCRHSSFNERIFFQMAVQLPGYKTYKAVCT